MHGASLSASHARAHVANLRQVGNNCRGMLVFWLTVSAHRVPLVLDQMVASRADSRTLEITAC